MLTTPNANMRVNRDKYHLGGELHWVRTPTRKYFLSYQSGTCGYRLIRRAWMSACSLSDRRAWYQICFRKWIKQWTIVAKIFLSICIIAVMHTSLPVIEANERLMKRGFLNRRQNRSPISELTHKTSRTLFCYRSEYIIGAESVITYGINIGLYSLYAVALKVSSEVNIRVTLYACCVLSKEVLDEILTEIELTSYRERQWSDERHVKRIPGIFKLPRCQILSREIFMDHWRII